MRENPLLFAISTLIMARFCVLCIKYPSENCVFGRTVSIVRRVVKQGMRAGNRAVPAGKADIECIVVWYGSIDFPTNFRENQ